MTNFSTKALIIAFTFFFSSAVLAIQNQYSVGYGPLQIFNKDAYSLAPIWLLGWLTLLLSTFVIGVFFALKQVIARWVVVVFIVSMTSGRLIFDFLNLPFLGGSIAIMHIIFWSPLLILLSRCYFDKNKPMSFRVWVTCLSILIITSLFFDIRDALIYIEHIQSLS